LQETQAWTEQQAITRDFVFRADSEAMIATRDAIIDFLRAHGIGEKEEIDILVALQEALANAVLHGCGNDSSKFVRCAVEIDPSAVRIVVRDPGPGFNTSLATDASENAVNLTEHGRGICLMRSLMDEVTYRHGGSEVELKKVRTQES